LTRIKWALFSHFDRQNGPGASTPLPALSRRFGLTRLGAKFRPGGDLATVPPVRDIAPAFLAFAPSRAKGNIGKQPVDFLSLTVGALTRSRATAKPRAVKPLAAAGAVDQEAVRPHLQAVPTRIALAGIIRVVSWNAGVIGLPATPRAEAAAVIAVCRRPLPQVRTAASVALGEVWFFFRFAE